MVTRASVAHKVLGSTPVGANFPGFNGVVFSVVGDVSIDSETPVVTLSISPGFAGPVFEDAHRGRVCVRVFIGVSVHALRVSALCCEILKKKLTQSLARSLSLIASQNR